MEFEQSTTLLVAIVQREDASTLIDEVNRQDYRATRINASGGVLSVGNVVVLIGVSTSEVDSVLQTIQSVCKTRTAFHFHMTGDLTVDGTLGPIEVEVGGAVVFALPVERHVQLQGSFNVKTGADS